MIDARAVIAALRETDARTGGRREAWRDGWAQERERLDELARAAVPELIVERDAFANTWYVLEGETEDTVLVGSHSDCVPDGGWLDGILGVHAGLGILGGYGAESGRPRRTLAVVDWADEEGTRFGRSLLGSAAATGALSEEELARLSAEDGTPAPEVVAEFGFAPSALGTPAPRLAQVVAATELHIEQGPRLERAGRSVAAVAGCLGVRRMRLSLEGTAGHAGALPMADRHDPVRGAATLITTLFDEAEQSGGLATVGRLASDPMIATAVPARCDLTLDIRHAELQSLTALADRARALARAGPCPTTIEDLYIQDPVAFDPELVSLATEMTGGGEPLTSGPLHDSAALAQAGLPVVMLFAPSVAGLSHARAEDTPEDDLVAALVAFDELVTRLLG